VQRDWFLFLPADYRQGANREEQGCNHRYHSFNFVGTSHERSIILELLDDGLIPNVYHRRQQVLNRLHP